MNRPPLIREELSDDPFIELSRWFKEADASGASYPNAFCLSTVDENGDPDARIVLLRGYGRDGFHFYTNYESRKGAQLEVNPRAAITFYWDALGRQVRVRGNVVRAAEAESDAYFASRPRESQLGAWASLQSRPLADRATLERRVAEADQKYFGTVVPRPPHWGGYVLIPREIELWQEQPFRLHDRFAYIRSGDVWHIERRYP